MTDKVPEQYRGLSREECRKRVVEDLEAQGLLEKIEPYKLSASICERCGDRGRAAGFRAVVRADAGAGQAGNRGRGVGPGEAHPRALEQGLPRLDVQHPRLVHLAPALVGPPHPGLVLRLRRDHRRAHDPTECPKCHSKNLKQDEDILDTWFSSALWPFSTLGWPEKTPDLAKFYPTDFLSTAPDIIFLWVARMIFSGLKFMGDIPFSRVYFHSFILVESGERMSRSKGIGIDPVDMFQKYGTDAVRFTLAYLESQSQSYRLSEKRFEFGRNFTQQGLERVPAGRAARGQGRDQSSGRQRPAQAARLPTNWIISRYNRTVEAVTAGSTPAPIRRGVRGCTSSSGTSSATGTWSSPSSG